MLRISIALLWKPHFSSVKGIGKPLSIGHPVHCKLDECPGIWSLSKENDPSRAVPIDVHYYRTPERASVNGLLKPLISFIFNLSIRSVKYRLIFTVILCRKVYDAPFWHKT